MKLGKLIKILVLGVVFIAYAAMANAQDKVSGTLTDQNGQPVVGATVMIVGTMNGTQTDFDGRWELQVPNPQSATLQFSCLGYETVEEAVGGRAVINVTIAENTEFLEEVVHVGYGTQKKVNLTGSVSSVDFSDLTERRTVTSTSAALAGLVPGMMVHQTSGQPGSESTTIRIRGTGSFTSSASSPLVLVDGVEWKLDDVNPNDIESISVLKDASSTAIYGTRAANGVILITTKTGTQQKAKVSYSFNGSFQRACNDNLDWVGDFADYCEYLNEACDNAGTGHLFGQATIDLWREAKKNPNGLNEYGVPNYMAYPNTDWFTELFHTGFLQEHQLSITGSSDSVRYSVSASYMDNNGVMPRKLANSSSQKFTFRTNLEADITKWLTIGTRLYGQFVALGPTSVSTIFEYLSMNSPGIWPGEPGKWGAPASNEDSLNSNNIFWQGNHNDGTNHTWKLNGTAYAMIKPYKGITIDGTVNYSPTFQQKHTYTKDYSRWDYTTDTPYDSTSLENATVTDYTYRNYYFNTEALARYEATFNKIHDFGVLLGYTTTIYQTWANQATKKGATDWNLNDGSTYSNMDSMDYEAKSGWALRSYFARVNYAVKDRYLFEANVRIDGSSVFGSNNRYGVFPSFSAGWKIHEEPWMQSASNWLSELKLRASWGQTGNNLGIGNFDWQSTYEAGTVVVDGSNATALYITSTSNSDLKWETTSSLDIGLDLGFFDHRLTAGIDYYYKNTRDILYTPSTYMTMGNFSNVPSNMGNLWNQGIEISLNWKDQVGDFYYYAGVNFSFNKNKVTKFKGALTQGYVDGEWTTNFSDVAESWSSPGYLIEGHEIGEHYIYKRYTGSGAGAVYKDGKIDITAGPKDGMIRTEADMDWVRAMIAEGYTFNGGSTIAKDQLWYGDFIYADLNGDGNYGNTHDRYFTGHSSTPAYNLGITFGFSWKGLDFSMIWSGAFDYYLNWNTTIYNTSTAQTERAVSKRIAEDHYFYDPENPTDSRTNINGTYPRLYNSARNNEQSDFYEYKSDYLKLKNVTLGYTFPQKWMSKCFIDQLRFYVSGENLFTITSYPGLDPEIGTSIGYPIIRQYTIGAQITF